MMLSLDAGERRDYDDATVDFESSSEEESRGDELERSEEQHHRGEFFFLFLFALALALKKKCE